MSLAGAAGGALAGPVLAISGYAGLSAATGVLVATVVAGAVVMPCANLHRKLACDA